MLDKVYGNIKLGYWARPAYTSLWKSIPTTVKMIKHGTLVLLNGCRTSTMLTGASLRMRTWMILWTL